MTPLSDVNSIGRGVVFAILIFLLEIGILFAFGFGCFYFQFEFFLIRWLLNF